MLERQPQLVGRRRSDAASGRRTNSALTRSSPSARRRVCSIDSTDGECCATPPERWPDPDRAGRRAESSCSTLTRGRSPGERAGDQGHQHNRDADEEQQQPDEDAGHGQDKTASFGTFFHRRSETAFRRLATAI